ESITVAAADVEAKVEEILEDLGGQTVDRDRLREVVEEDLIREQIFAFLEENATIELVPEGTLVKEEPVEAEPAADAATETAEEADAALSVEALESTSASDPMEPAPATEAAVKPAEKSSKSARSKSAKANAEASEIAESEPEAIADLATADESATKPAGRKRTTSKPKQTED
ncbi:MAG: hypothetical protein D6742_02905, partial [Cyanobacteria bacterium J069]